MEKDRTRKAIRKSREKDYRRYNKRKQKGQKRVKRNNMSERREKGK